MNGNGEAHATPSETPTPTLGGDAEKSDLLQGAIGGHGTVENEKIIEGVEDDENPEVESEEDTEEDDDDDDEPVFKYEVVGDAVNKFLVKDTASAIAVSNNLVALGTHNGIVHVFELSSAGVFKHINHSRSHSASVTDITLDSTGAFIGTASMDGRVVVYSITSKDSGSSNEAYTFTHKRPMRTLALDPGFASKAGRSVVCGGMDGRLVHYEKGWLGLPTAHRETVLHSGEGPIWSVRWRGSLIAWANDKGVKLYDTTSSSRITYIDRPADAPRADLYKCTLTWHDDFTLLIAWADVIKVAKIRPRERPAHSRSESTGSTRVPSPAPSSSTSSRAKVTQGGALASLTMITQLQQQQLPPWRVELVAVFQVDCMIAGLLTYSSSPSSSSASTPASPNSEPDFLVLSYTPPIVPPSSPNGDSDDFSSYSAASGSGGFGKRLPSEPPELKLITAKGEENCSDVLTVAGYESWGCNDYALVWCPPSSSLPSGSASPSAGEEGDWKALTMTPKGLVWVRRRDRRDRIEWLLERKRYAEALELVYLIEEDKESDDGAEVRRVGMIYIGHLLASGDFEGAAELTPRVLGSDRKMWEDTVFGFAERGKLKAIIPFIPMDPPLDNLVYEMVLAHLMTADQAALLQTVKEWPKDVYDAAAVIVAVRSELERVSPDFIDRDRPRRPGPVPAASTSTGTRPPRICSPADDQARFLMETLALLYKSTRQPSHALPYLLALGKKEVFDLIREFNLYTTVVEFAFELVRFDLERSEMEVGVEKGGYRGEGLDLLVEQAYSIPVGKVVEQLGREKRYCFLYLDRLSEKDPALTSEFADMQVELNAQFAPEKLITFLRASSYYSYEKAYDVCKRFDLVPELVYLLGQMGNFKEALKLIIDRLGDVNRALDFVTEHRDPELWEDLVTYSESKPTFIRALLLNSGGATGVDPVKLIRRIRNGLKIEGLQEALVKILSDFSVASSLLTGCRAVLEGDLVEARDELRRGRLGGSLLNVTTPCCVCGLPLFDVPQAVAVLYLCRHVIHLRCAELLEGEELPARPDSMLEFVSSVGLAGTEAMDRTISGNIAFASIVKSKMKGGCPIHNKQSRGFLTSS